MNAFELIKERLKKEYRHHWQLWRKKLNSEDWAYKDAYTKALSIVSEVEAEYGNGFKSITDCGDMSKEQYEFVSMFQKDMLLHSNMTPEEAWDLGVLCWKDRHEKKELP